MPGLVLVTALLLLAGCGEYDGRDSDGRHGDRRHGDRRHGDAREPTAPRDRAGSGARGLGDFDKDGYDDYAAAVTAAGRKLRRTPEGRRVVVIPGSRRGLDTVRRRAFTGLGGPLLRADLDGDGYTDLAATRDPDRIAQAKPRKAVILYGGRKGLGAPVPVAAEGDFTLAAVADVNGDGHPDLIDRGAGRVQADPDVRSRPGRVAYGPISRKGTPARLVGQDWRADEGGITTGDFDGDRRDDLVFTTTQVPEPDEDLGPTFVSSYFRGGPDGPVRATYPKNLGNAIGDGPTIPAAGDVDGDGRTDLLGYGDRHVGYGEAPTGGQLTITYGAKGGPGTGRRPVVLDQETPGIPGDSQHGDHFGAGAGTGDVTGDGRPDLVVDSPGEDSESGRCTLIPGTPEGPAPSRATAVDLDAPGVPGERYALSKDNFGATFPLLDVDGDKHADVVAVAIGYFVKSKPGLWLFPGATTGFATHAAQHLDPASVGLDPRHWG